jgi:hypothetical protein
VKAEEEQGEEGSERWHYEFGVVFNAIATNEDKYLVNKCQRS